MTMTRHASSRLAGLIALLATSLLTGCSKHFALLDPSGPIGAHEKWIIIVAFLLMLIVVIPVFAMTFLFAWKYRASNKKADYAPKWDHSGKIEAVVWTVPALIIMALGYLVWTGTHQLSPYQPLATRDKPVKVEAVAMNWKWLFIYPDQHIATVNQLVFPAHRPVSFRITSDTVMTSFFIPRLGSQIYAMAGMQTKLHLLADKPGTFTGRNFQFSGKGYADMHFKAVATTPGKFRAWVHRIKDAGQSKGALNLTALHRLEKPSDDETVVHFSSVRPHLFDYIIHKYKAAKAATQQAAKAASPKTNA